MLDLVLVLVPGFRVERVGPVEGDRELVDGVDLAVLDDAHELTAVPGRVEVAFVGVADPFLPVRVAVQGIARLDVPDFQDPVAGSGDEVLPVGKELRLGHDFVVALELLQKFPAGLVEEKPTVGGSHDEEAPVRAVGEGGDVVEVVFHEALAEGFLQGKAPDRFSREVDDLDAVSVLRVGDLLAVGADREGRSFRPFRLR